MERIERINRLGELIQQTFDEEPRDGKLERTYNIDSLYRANAGLHFRGLMGVINLLKMSAPEPSLRFRIKTEGEQKALSQWLVDVALQRIAIRLDYIFDITQKKNREEIEKIVKNDKSRRASKSTLHNLIEERHGIANKIEDLKKRFEEVIDLAKNLGFEVFDEDVHRYRWYYVLNTNREEYIISMRAKN